MARKKAARPVRGWIVSGLLGSNDRSTWCVMFSGKGGDKKPGRFEQYDTPVIIADARHFRAVRKKVVPKPAKRRSK